MAIRLKRWAGTALMTAGLAILLVTGGFYAYGQYGQYEANQDVQTILPSDVILDSPTPELLPAVFEPTVTPIEVTETPGVPFETSVPLETSVPQIVLPSATPSPVPTQTPIPVMPMQRLIATSIGLDTKVVEAPIINGEWTVPRFVAGHLLGTAQPLQGSNVVLSGHVQSISSGNVFARIGELKIGDVIRVSTRVAVITYVVSESRVVANNDITVVQPSPLEILTLITCTGTWLPFQRDYDRRIIVTASRQV